MMLMMLMMMLTMMIIIRYGNVTYYTDMIPAHKRNDSAMGGGFENWFSHYMIGINGLCTSFNTAAPGHPLSLSFSFSLSLSLSLSLIFMLNYLVS